MSRLSAIQNRPPKLESPSPLAPGAAGLSCSSGGLPTASGAHPARVAVLVVTWNHSRVIERCLTALDGAETPPGGFRVLILDNASRDGTAERVRAYLRTRSESARRRVQMELRVASRNTGFAGGMNHLLRHALRTGARFVYLLNPDTVVDAQFLRGALRAMADPCVGIVQSLLLLHGAPDRVNSWGNELHWLGFGTVGGHDCPIRGRLARAHLGRREIGYASGAAMLVRAEVFEGVGLFDEKLFAYHEDLELSWRARLAGWRVVLEPDSIVHHDYEFARYRRKFYLAERNRVVVLFSCFQTSTLALLAPALLCAEVGVWLAAMREGWWREKWESYRSLWRAETLRWIRERRRLVAHVRRHPDGALAHAFSARFPGQGGAPRLARWLLLAPLQFYCRTVRTLLSRAYAIRSAWWGRAGEQAPAVPAFPALRTVSGIDRGRQAA